MTVEITKRKQQIEKEAEIVWNRITEFKCPTITITRESEKRWIVSDYVTPIVGKGATREGALECYHRGLDLLQQKHAGIETDINSYLDHLEQEKLK